MRQGRFLAPWKDCRSAVYHCVSRVVNRDFVFQRLEKENFVRLMRKYEAFCGVRILSYCVMSNHFHLLVEVPPRPRKGLALDEFYRRLAVLYSEGEIAAIRGLIDQCQLAGGETDVAALMERYLYRMWDLSQFMKSLKQTFTRWFNKKHKRCGTLWESRFKSVIVQSGHAARVISAYIDLNPIRAGIVTSPQDYRWCNYAEAEAGGHRAREGIIGMMREYEQEEGVMRRQEPEWRDIVADYRAILISDGEEQWREDPVTGRCEVARRGIPRAEVERVRSGGGKLSLGQMLHARVRYFVDGMAIGTCEFLDELHETTRERFGSNRRSGARPMRGCRTNLCSLRDLRVDPLG